MSKKTAPVALIAEILDRRGLVPMTALTLGLLKVSLTKHGAAKLATLLKKHSANDVLASLSGKEPGINIDDAQAKKNLSVDSRGRVSDIWRKVRSLGDRSIDGLTLIAIVARTAAQCSCDRPRAREVS
jgi:hypothetical protein